MTTHFAIARSTYIKGLEWCSGRIPYPEPGIKGDTYPMTWADDGEIYAAAGDPYGERRGTDWISRSSAAALPTTKSRRSTT